MDIQQAEVQTAEKIDTVRGASEIKKYIENAVFNGVLDKIAAILRIQKDESWEITDVVPDKGLYMVTTKKGFEDYEDGKIRGIVVDVNAGCVVAQMPSHPEWTVIPELSDEFIESNYGQTDLDIIRGYEGTFICVMKHDDVVYVMTQRKIIPGKSHWRGSLPFVDAYDLYEGPREQLFGEGSYSPYCHRFIVAYSDFLICSRNPFQGLVYLGHKKMWDPESSPYLSVDDSLFDLGTERLGKNIKLPKKLSINEAKNYLKYGTVEIKKELVTKYSTMDYRLVPGEYIVVKDNKSGRTDILVSKSYQFRADFIEGNPNLYSRLCQLLFLTRKDADTFYQWIPRQTSPTLKEIRNSVWNFKAIRNTPYELLLHGESESDMYYFDILNDEHKIKLIWQTLLLCIPRFKMHEVFLYYEKLRKDKTLVYDWLVHLTKLRESDKMKEAGAPDQALALIQRTYDYTKRGSDIARKKKPGSKFEPRIFQFHFEKNLNKSITADTKNFYKYIKAAHMWEERTRNEKKD